MHYRIKLFGIFEDRLKRSEIELDAEELLNMGTLRNMVSTLDPVFNEVQHYMIAVNQVYCDQESQIMDPKDEIAFIPPIAGG